MEKDVQFAFRVDSMLRKSFIDVCKEIDRPAGQVLREYMREFISQQKKDSSFTSNGVPAYRRTEEGANS